MQSTSVFNYRSIQNKPTGRIKKTSEISGVEKKISLILFGLRIFTLKGFPGVCLVLVSLGSHGSDMLQGFNRYLLHQKYNLIQAALVFFFFIYVI